MNYIKKTKNQLLEEIEELKSKIDTLKREGSSAFYEEKITLSTEAEKSYLVSAIDSVIVKDGDGRINDLNNPAVLRLGRTRNELIGKNESEIFDENVSNLRKHKLNELIFSRRSVRWQDLINGRWYDNIMYLLEGFDTENVRAIEISRDISAIKSSELEFREIIENSLQGIIIYQDQKIVYANSRTAKIFNISIDEVYAVRSMKNIVRFVHPDDHAMLEEYLWKHIEGISVPHRFEVKGIREDKTIVWLEVYTVFTDYMGKPAIQISLIDISERKRADEAFRESEERFKIASILASDSIYEVNLESNQAKIYSSSKISEKLNMHTEIMSMELWSRFIHPDDRDRIQIAKERLHIQGEPFSEEYRLLLDDNRVVYLLSRAHIIKNEEGKPIKEIGVTTDITARRVAEGILERERKLFLGGPLVVFRWSAAELWPVEYVSENVTHFGYMPEDFTARRILYSNFIHKEDFQAVAENISNFTEAGVSFFEHDYRIRHANGDTMWVYDFTVINRGKKGEAVNYESYILDITDRKNIEEALKLSKERYSLAIEAGKVVVWDWDLQMDKRYTSSNINMLLGYDKGEIIEEIKDWNKYIYPEDRGLFIRERMKCFDDITGKIEFKYRMLHKDGSIKWMLSRGIILRNENGKAYRMMGTETDITEIKKLEEELISAKENAENANASKNEFLANISHELKTPLNGILGYAQLMKRDNRLPESTHAGLDIVLRSGEHLSKIINDLLSFAKIEYGGIKVEKVNFRFIDMLNRITELLRISAQEKRIAFTFKVSNDIPAVVRSDEKFLSQIILNLLDNAIKFTYQGEVSFIVDKNDGLVRFTIQDTGIGIPRDYIGEIFKPFSKITGKERMMKGTGLGLTISNELLKMLGGELFVASEIGKGSKFWFELNLPEVDDRIEMDSSEFLKITGYKGEPRKILIVDDIYQNRSFLVLLLKSLGFMVYEANNGIEALDRVVKHKPHLIFMDILMPQMDGIEAVRKLRTDGSTADIKIIALTAGVISEEKIEILKEDFDDVVIKPIHIDEIFNKVREHLKLEWIYDSPMKKMDSGYKGTELDFQNSEIPPIEDVKNLYLMAKSGDILGLQENLDKLEGLHENYSNFARNFKSAILNYEIKKLRDFAINQLENRHENH